MLLQVACGWNAQHCRNGLQEVCVEQAQPDHIVERWLHAFRGGRECNKHKPVTVRLLTASSEVYIACVGTLLNTNRQWTCAELSNSLFSPSTDSSHSIWEILAQWVPCNVTGKRGNLWKLPDCMQVIVSVEMKPFFTASLKCMRHWPIPTHWNCRDC